MLPINFNRLNHRWQRISAYITNSTVGINTTNFIRINRCAIMLFTVALRADEVIIKRHRTNENNKTRKKILHNWPQCCMTMSFYCFFFALAFITARRINEIVQHIDSVYIDDDFDRIVLRQCRRCNSLALRACAPKIKTYSTKSISYSKLVRLWWMNDRRVFVWVDSQDRTPYVWEKR